jgi:polyisoprenoid-binding protein YceI
MEHQMRSRRTRRFWQKILVAVVAVFMAATPAAAQREQVVTFDPDNTKVDFVLGDILHTVHGTFKLKSGVIRFDRTTGAASGALVVDGTSGDSGNKSRDKKMNRDVLESEKYPEIAFIAQKVSGSIPPQGRSQVNVEGVFRMHGSEHPLTLTVPIEVNGDRITASTQFVVPYQKWGLRNPSTLFLRVSDKVEISIAANGRISAEQARLTK